MIKKREEKYVRIEWFKKHLLKKWSGFFLPLLFFLYIEILLIFLKNYFYFPKKKVSGLKLEMINPIFYDAFSIKEENTQVPP